MSVASMIRDWVTEYGPIETDDTFQPGRFGVIGRDRLLRLADMVERLERVERLEGREWPTDRNDMPFTVGDRIFLEHNQRVRTVTSLMLQDKGVWIVGCDEGGAFLWPESKDNVTLLDDGSEEA